MNRALQATPPFRWGMQAGPLHRLPWGERAVREFGFDRWYPHAPMPGCDQGQGLTSEAVAQVHAIDEWCARQGITWIANLEGANWHPRYVDETGQDWFNRADGRHYYDPSGAMLAGWGACRRLDGLLYDEAELMQLWRNGSATGNLTAENSGLSRRDPTDPYQNWIWRPDGRLEDAEAAFSAAAADLASRYARYGIKLRTEHVLPVLFHSFARAGWTAATKVLKEGWAGPYLACAMGAALQYGTELDVCADLWDGRTYPGHSPREYRSALLLAYHLGADCIYTESLHADFNNRCLGSLVLASKIDYTVTPYGKEALWFRHEYLPAHPRGYSFRDVRPRVAIIRQEDSCFGQAASWLPDHLFGSTGWPSTATTEAWLRLWHLLSLGVIPADSLSWHAGSLRSRPHQLFSPQDGVVVFDHRVLPELLTGVEVIFLTGLGIGPETLDGVARQVAAGATCVALPHLLPENVARATGRNGVLKDGAGRWVATEDFLAPHARQAVRHILPEPGTLRYWFGNRTVLCRPVDGDPDNLEVDTQSVLPRVHTSLATEMSAVTQP